MTDFVVAEQMLLSFTKLQPLLFGYLKNEARFLHTVDLLCFYWCICSLQHVPMLVYTGTQVPLAYKWELVVLPCKFLNNSLTQATTINHISAGRMEDLHVAYQMLELRLQLRLGYKEASRITIYNEKGVGNVRPRPLGPQTHTPLPQSWFGLHVYVHSCG